MEKGGARMGKLPSVATAPPLPRRPNSFAVPSLLLNRSRRGKFQAAIMASLVLPSLQSPSPSCRKRGFTTALDPLFDHTLPLSKRLCCATVSNLAADFDHQLIEKVVKASKSDLDSTTESLNTIRTTNDEEDSELYGVKSSMQVGVNARPTIEEMAEDNHPSSCVDWAELVVSEMTKASNMNDARFRASRVVEMLEKSVKAQASVVAAQSFSVETETLRQRTEDLLHDNTILKRAVVIMHDRQKDYDAMSQEMKQLKQMVSEYEDRVRALEVGNYALAAHLRQALQASPIPGRTHPDVF